ncbi:hypothetical protein VIN01S_24490 [Vibrio inusitatus NBRC 102082]|uniref:Uncharacterized protein n=1 Tax=Vibrio inusitatus NBRC 102082 TaxID=1219070 RepID=A0A4Y3HX80_9VIBR|nr:hypothetical protein VIN01S_24490 [Vibrio inusitatus NBRC 102082]
MWREDFKAAQISAMTEFELDKTVIAGISEYPISGFEKRLIERLLVGFPTHLVNLSFTFTKQKHEVTFMFVMYLYVH